MYGVSCGHSHTVPLQPYINLALECKSRGHLDEAIVWLEQGAEAADTSANLMFNLGVMYQTQGMSQHVCRRGGRWRPHYWWLATGAILAANKAYNRALALDPKYPEPRMNVAALHHRYGDVEQAVEQYQILLALPDLGTGMEANLRKNLAQAYLDLGDVAASLDGTNGVQESWETRNICSQRAVLLAQNMASRSALIRPSKIVWILLHMCPVPGASLQTGSTTKRAWLGFSPASTRCGKKRTCAGGHWQSIIPLPRLWWLAAPTIRLRCCRSTRCYCKCPHSGDSVWRSCTLRSGST